MSMVLFPFIGLFAWIANLVILIWILQVLKDIRADIRTRLVRPQGGDDEGK